MMLRSSNGDVVIITPFREIKYDHRGSINTIQQCTAYILDSRLVLFLNSKAISPLPHEAIELEHAKRSRKVS
jgi:hypothetical protein